MAASSSSKPLCPPSSGDPLKVDPALNCQEFHGPGLALRSWTGWLGQQEAAALLERLQREVPWKQESIQIYGRCYKQPRLTCWMADPGCCYRYSGLQQHIEPWHPAVLELLDRLEVFCGRRFNAVLLNLYRDGRDAMGWHADDEPELDADAPIASVSLGASRSFRLRPKPGASLSDDPLRVARTLELAHGDLLVMDPPTQCHWQHALPRRLRVHQPRLNLTFRRVRQARTGEP